MEKRNSSLNNFLLPIFFLLLTVVAAYDENNDTIIPAIFTFGDSSVDVGNNNHLKSAMFKADYFPYGKDLLLVDHIHPTGRFSNGMLTTDFGAEGLGFKHAQHGYLSSSFRVVGVNSFITGANFASAGSGYYDGTSMRYNAIPLSKQLELFKAYKSKLFGVTGEKKGEDMLSKSVFIVSTGNGDYVQNYYLNRSLRKRYNIEKYSTFIVGLLADILEKRRLRYFSLPCSRSVRKEEDEGQVEEEAYEEVEEEASKNETAIEVVIFTKSFHQTFFHRSGKNEMYLVFVGLVSD